MTPATLDVLTWQKKQVTHALRNHGDIAYQHRITQLMHYGLHYAKYAGRLARDDSPQNVARTLTDACLICLSAATMLQQKLDMATWPVSDTRLLAWVDAIGRFGDACEKIDHMEPFHEQIRQANWDVMVWILAKAKESNMDLGQMIEERRAVLAGRLITAEAWCVA